jgi:hypothetical protein
MSKMVKRTFFFGCAIIPVRKCNGMCSNIHSSYGIFSYEYGGMRYQKAIV